MAELAQLCRSIRSKNAGPFWITIDLFFRDRETFDAHADAPELTIQSVAPLLGIAPEKLRRFALPDIAVVKFSYPRPAPQGGRLERDMHGGQQFVPLLAISPTRRGDHPGADGQVASRPIAT